MKRLHVIFDNTELVFEGEDAFELIDRARAHKLYKTNRIITFELEEVEDGDKCSKCEKT